MMSKKILVALGGNAILTDNPTAKGQILALEKTAKQLVKLVEAGCQLIISHGNGPQVGNLLLQQNAADTKANPALPLDTCVAMTQGSIGYWLQNRLQAVLKEKGIDKSVVSLLTQVEVSGDDSAFANPTKPIGPFVTKEDAESISQETNDTFVEDSGRGYRKVVPSPKPMSIVEYKVIESLVANQIITIACGGGGIPVIKKDNGIEGVEAVIDKDFASAKLAELLKVDQMIILTGVDNVYVNFNKPNQKKLEEVTIAQLKDYIQEEQFAAGSMLPKVQAAMSFVENYPQGEAVITSLDNLENYLNGGTATIVKA
ncbi:carbamate kinase [Streptococcus thoraltensis]|uniref:carbamate kinase n=1 Tax=Streptococcus thoraltensis TaxID=55085 RepID=UPI0004768181|nr:carbamate kinase [Streptococcus thoraltensis]